jgi:hypothetical protein
MKYTTPITKIKETSVGQPVMSLTDHGDVVAGMKGVITRKANNAIDVRWNRGDLVKINPSELRLFAFGPKPNNETN